MLAQAYPGDIPYLVDTQSESTYIPDEQIIENIPPQVPRKSLLEQCINGQVSIDDEKWSRGIELFASHQVESQKSFNPKSNVTNSSYRPAKQTQLDNYYPVTPRNAGTVTHIKPSQWTQPRIEIKKHGLVSFIEKTPEKVQHPLGLHHPRQSNEPPTSHSKRLNNWSNFSNSNLNPWAQSKASVNPRSSQSPSPQKKITDTFTLERTVKEPHEFVRTSICIDTKPISVSLDVVRKASGIVKEHELARWSRIGSIKPMTGSDITLEVVRMEHVIYVIPKR